ncbi:SDR family oxidoreductase [Zhouia sp. PK063]|uniref:SDR family oxidoreductase n=1 Tax=Zhouia sp. PK063 TaxID=3373602 RepID=UPI0037B3FDFA
MKTALITGANRGIGFETAKQLITLGYFVYLGSRDLNRGEQAVQQLKALGLNTVEVLEIDIAKSESITNAKTQLSSKIKVLDVLINNAGILGEMPQQVSATSLENYHTVFQTNVFGTIEITQQFLSLLKKSEAPRIVNVSSEVGSITGNSDPTWEKYESVKAYPVYSASKTALNAFTVALAYEFRNTNFKINSVTPGYTATEFNDYKGFKTVEEGAKPIVNFATLTQDGVTGKFYSLEGEVRW